MKLSLLLALAALPGIALTQGQGIRDLLTQDSIQRARKLADDPKTYAPGLREVLADTDPKWRKLALVGFREMDFLPQSVRAENKISEELREQLVPLLATACRDEDEEVANAAMTTLLHYLRVRDWGHHGEPWGKPEKLQPLVDLGEKILPTAKKALLNVTSEQYGIRVSACRVVARIKSSKSLEILLEAIPVTDDFLLSEAMNAAAKYDDPRVGPAIIEHIDKHILSYEDTPGTWALRRMKKPPVDEMIRQLGNHPREQVRQRLAHAFEHIIAPDAAPALIRALQDKDEYVRAYAAATLRHYPGVPTENSLIRATGDKSDSVRESAVHSLVQLQAKAGFAVVQKALSDPQIRVRIAATGLARIDGERALPILLPLAKDEKLAHAVAVQLRYLQNPRAIPVMMELLGGTVEVAVEQSALGLAEMGVKQAIPKLIELLKNDDIVYSACDALQIFGPDAADALIEYFPKSTSDRRSVIEALATSKSSKAVDLILGSLADEDLRYAAIASLGKLGDPRAIAPIMNCLDDPRDTNVSQAAEALGALKAQVAIPKLIAVMNGKGEYSDSSAAGALAKIGDVSALEPLLKYLSVKREGQWMALQHMGNFKDKRVFDLLILRLKGGFPWNKGAIDGLIGYGSKAAIPALRAYLEEEDLDDETKEHVGRAIAALERT